MPRWNVVLGLAVVLGTTAWSVPAVAVDDGLEDPNACSSPFGGGDSREGSVVTVPGGWPMPTGTPPPPPSSIPGASYPPPLTTYVCSNGGWVPVSSALEVGLRVDPDEPSVAVDEGSTAVMTGTYINGGDSPPSLAASAGTVIDLGNGTWSWSMAPADGPRAEAVTVTATMGEKSASATFDLVVSNVAPTVSGIEPVTPVVMVGQPVVFSGAATDPSPPDTATGFSWTFEPHPATFTTCGSHTVSGTATDRDGGISGEVTSSPVEVVEAAFQQPLANSTHNLVRAGQVVPVRVQIGCNGSSAGSVGLIPTVRLVSGDVDPATTADAPELIIPPVSAQGDTTGLMRQAAAGYLYNLKVPAAARGTLFTVRVSPSTGAHTLNAVLEVR